MPDLYRCTLNPSGANYEHWLRIFGDHSSIPLQSAKSFPVTFGEEKGVECYLLNLSAMTLGQRARLLGFVAQKFGVPVYEVQKQIEKEGFPIRAKDVIVSFDMRAFV